MLDLIEWHAAGMGPLVLTFPGTIQADRAQVGGKGESLVRMLAAGMPVPPGVVLTTEFFEPWFAQLRTSATWQELIEEAPTS